MPPAPALQPDAQPAAAIRHGDLTIRFPHDPVSGHVGLELVPTALLGSVAVPRERLDEREVAMLPSSWNVVPAATADCLVQLSCTGDERAAGYAQGRTLRGGGTMAGLRFADQAVERAGARTVVRTRLRHANGLRVEHELTATDGDPVLDVVVHVENGGQQPLTLELLSSFSLAGITPFHAAHAPERLRLHRWRSAWSAEARLCSESVEDLHLERSWQAHSVACERFGQVGSLPCRGFMPQAAVEDRVAGVTWAAQLACGGSWQMEFYRRGDRLGFSGGLADREFGHWLLTLAPGERISTPRAALTVVHGGVDAACDRLVRHQRRGLTVPAAERDLPVIVNEFCASWGNPTHDHLVRLAGRLAGSGARYLVIDAGWYAGPGRSWFDAHGDWEVSAERFPHGLAATGRAIREAGLVPGIWFELETVGADSAAYREDGLLTRDGLPLAVARRRFRDLRDPAQRARMLDRLLAILREGGFGYLKVDYNETIGVGPDGDAAPGEELRRCVAGSHALFDALRAAMPELVVETCASGGHRLEPSYLGRAAMGSFSDAHETDEAPIIAANLHRCIHPRQNQVWAVLRAEDGPERQVFALAAGFLGRLCLSGRIDELPAADWERARAAIALYARCADVIDAGTSHLIAERNASWRAPHGWQALRRDGDDGRTVLVVAHGFAGAGGRTVTVPLPAGRWRLAGSLAASATVAAGDAGLAIGFPTDTSAAVALLERDSWSMA